MEKKTITFYGNSTHTVDLAMMTALSFGKRGIKTAIIELGERNPQLAYLLGIEEQQIKTVDHYLENSRNGRQHISNNLITPQMIVECIYHSNLKNQIKKLPSISILAKKPVSEGIQLPEEEWKKAIGRIQEEIYEEHDVLIFSTNGRMFGYEVFFPAMAAQELILVVEDRPEDIRGLNHFVLELLKINEEIHTRTILLNYGNVHESDFDKTALREIINLNLKAIHKLKFEAWGCFEQSLKEIDTLVDKIIGSAGQQKKGFKIFKK